MAVLLLLYVVNVHSLWIYELLPDNKCGVDHQRHDFEALVWPWISAIINVYLPIVVSATLSIILAVAPRPAYVTAAASSALDHPGVDDVQLTRVCVTVSVLYIFTSLPAIAVNLVEYFLPGWPVSDGDRLRFYMAVYVCGLMASVYNAGGYLLVLGGVSAIRQAAVEIVGCHLPTLVSDRRLSTTIELGQRPGDGDETML